MMRWYTRVSLLVLALSLLTWLASVYVSPSMKVGWRGETYYRVHAGF